MAFILQRNTQSVTVEFTPAEYHVLTQTPISIEERGYEFVFETPQTASDLLKSF